MQVMITSAEPVFDTALKAIWGGHETNDLQHVIYSARPGYLQRSEMDLVTMDFFRQRLLHTRYIAPIQESVIMADAQREFQFLRGMVEKLDWFLHDPERLLGLVLRTSSQAFETQPLYRAWRERLCGQGGPPEWMGRSRSDRATLARSLCYAVFLWYFGIRPLERIFCNRPYFSNIKEHVLYSLLFRCSNPVFEQLAYSMRILIPEALYAAYYGIA